MDQPNIVENIFVFLDGRDLFFVRQVCIFWKDVCEYLLKTLRYIECEWYRTHLIFLDTIANNSLIKTHNSVTGWPTQRLFLPTLGVIVEIFDTIFQQNECLNYIYEVVFTDYLGTQFGMTLLKNPSVIVCDISEYNLISCKIFVFFDQNLRAHEIEISFVPKFRFSKTEHSTTELFNNCLTNDQFCLPTTTNLNHHNNYAICEDDIKTKVEITETNKKNVFKVNFQKNNNVDNVWKKVERLGVHQYAIVRDPVETEVFFLEIYNEKSRLLKIKNHLFHQGIKIVYCSVRNKLLQCSFEGSSHKLFKFCEFYEPPAKKHRNAESRKFGNGNYGHKSLFNSKEYSSFANVLKQNSK